MATSSIPESSKSDNPTIGEIRPIGHEDWQLYVLPSHVWPYRMRNLTTGADLGFKGEDERESFIELAEALKLALGRAPHIMPAGMLARAVGLALTPNFTSMPEVK